MFFWSHIPSSYSPITTKFLQKIAHVHFILSLFSYSFLLSSPATYQFTGTVLVEISDDLQLAKL